MAFKLLDVGQGRVYNKFNCKQIRVHFEINYDDNMFIFPHSALIFKVTYLIFQLLDYPVQPL